MLPLQAPGQSARIMAVDVSIVIVNWNTRELLLRCIQSISDTLTRLAFQVVVVDNASTDDSALHVRKQFPDVKWIQNQTNVGFARACNQGIELGIGRYVMLLNSDTVLRPLTVEKAILFMDNRSDAGIVGGKLLNPDGSFQASYNDDPSVLSELVTSAGLARWVFGKYYPSHTPEESTGVRAVDWVGGACLVARRAAIDQVGPLDPTYYMYSEDLEWCYRFRRAGWKVYFLPDLEVFHWAGQSSHPIEESKLLWLTKSRVRFLAGHTNRIAIWALQACLRISAVAKALAWLAIASLAGGRRASSMAKVRSNLRVASWSRS